MQFSRPEDGKVAGLQRQITGLVVIDEPEIGVGMIGAVAHIGMGPDADPLLPPQQQLDIQILLMKLAAAIRDRLGQRFAHQTKQLEAVYVLLAKRRLTPVGKALHHLGHDAGQRRGQGGALQGIQTAGDHGVRILRYICRLSLSINEKGPLKVLIQRRLPSMQTRKAPDSSCWRRVTVAQSPAPCQEIPAHSPDDRTS
ncbi:hypothetical protein D3C75_627590 [compost metagenome]